MPPEAPIQPRPVPAAAFRAYGAIQAARSQREQEADVFVILAGRLRAALRLGGMARVRAAADARRVFSAVEMQTLHPTCPLPRELRLLMCNVTGRALREVEQAEPDLEFLAAIADDFAVGLGHRPREAA